MKTTVVSRICKICFTLAAAVLLFFVLQGCYHGIGRELFYRLEYHSFQLVDPEGHPIDGRKIASISKFSYRSNWDPTGKHTRYHVEPIRFDEKGRARRFGWVRNRVSLSGFYIPKLYYPYSREFIPETDGNVITLLPIRYPTPLFHGKVAFRVDEDFCGKLQFRFSDLELSIPYHPLRWNSRKKGGEWQKQLGEQYQPDFTFDFQPDGRRLAYRWNNQKKAGEWQLRSATIPTRNRWNDQTEAWELQWEPDEKYQPDLVFDFKPDGRVTAEFMRGIQSEFQRHHSVFPGPYYAPPPGYYKRLLIEKGYDGFHDLSANPIVFSFSFQGRNCYGVLRRMQLEKYNNRRNIEFEFLLNPAGDSNLEPGKRIPKHGQSELWKEEQTIRPVSVLNEFCDKEKKPQPEIHKLWGQKSEKLQYSLFGYIRNGIRYITHIRYSQKNRGEKTILICRESTTGCKPELLDVNFDGYPDLLLHNGCSGGRHRYEFYITRDPGNEYLYIVWSPLFTEKLQGHLSLDPSKRLIRVLRQDPDGKTIRKTYQVSSDPHIDTLSRKYLTEYNDASEKNP